MKEQSCNLDVFFTSLPTIIYRLLIGNLRYTLTRKLKAVVHPLLVHSLLSCALLNSQSLHFPSLPLLLLLFSPTCFSVLLITPQNFIQAHSIAHRFCSPVACVCCELKGKIAMWQFLVSLFSMRIRLCHP